MTFQIRPLPRADFAELFGLSDAALAERGVVVHTADAKPGFPCRVSLEDAEPGERVLLVNYEHQPADTPFRSRYAVFVRDGAQEARPAPGEVPELLRSRVLSVRAFDADGMLIDADLCEGAAVEATIARLLGDPAAACLHLHYAKPGCFAALVERV
jgi:hypothetical protein